MSEQPEAIRLAAVCDLGHPLEDDMALIGPELLRLHAVESGAKVELMRRDNLIDSLHGMCESYRTQVESLTRELHQATNPPFTGKTDSWQAACGKARTERDEARAQVERLQAEQASTELRQAAQALVDRWDMPCWKGVQHTGEFINKLRVALAAEAPLKAWSPAYTRGPARQSAPVTAVPALVPLSVLQYNQIPELCQIRPSLYESVVRAIEAAIAKINGLTVGDGAQPIKDAP